MMMLWAVVQRELKVQLRSAWMYSLVVIFAGFLSIIMYVSGDIVGLGTYSHTTATMMNVIGYFLPLMTLIVGAFSLTMEKEDGSWSLLSTYPLSSITWVAGKWLGMLVVLFTIITFAFSIGGMITFFTQPATTFASTFSLYFYAVSLIALFLAIAVLIGVLSRNRWQALTICVAIWTIFVLAWPILFMSALHSLPYRTALQVLQGATLMNPAEMTRIFFTVKLDGGHIFGPQYIDWIAWAGRPESVLYFMLMVGAWSVGSIFISGFIVERSRYHG